MPCPIKGRGLLPSAHCARIRRLPPALTVARATPRLLRRSSVVVARAPRSPRTPRRRTPCSLSPLFLSFSRARPPSPMPRARAAAVHRQRCGRGAVARAPRRTPSGTRAATRAPTGRRRSRGAPTPCARARGAAALFSS